MRLLSIIIPLCTAFLAEAAEAPFVIPKDVARPQWTEEQAWQWHRQAGVLKGFNEPMPAYPDMTTEHILATAADLGFNSVRIFLRGKLPEHKEFLRGFLDKAEAHGLSVCPVLQPNATLRWKDREAASAFAKSYVQEIVYTFRNDPRIDLWDVFNEPGPPASHIALAKAAIRWAREAGPTQPITCSAYHWMTFVRHNTPERRELAGMCDVHNFHCYMLNWHEMQGIERMVSMLQGIAKRPMVCSEWLARSQGDNFSRALPYFAKHKIHWHSWGLYICDRNWEVIWDSSAFHPSPLWFHEMLHPDGTPFDYREVELVRNFSFERDTDPGIEKTGRWLKQRAWRYCMIGPTKGWTYLPPDIDNPKAMWMADLATQQTWAADLAQLASRGCDGLRVHLDFPTWRQHPDAFLEKVDHFLDLAAQSEMSVTPVLITDRDAGVPIEDLKRFTRSLVARFGRDPRIFCWELYHRPGAGGASPQLVAKLLTELFRSARFQFPGQPLTATPDVTVEEFPEGFNHIRALTHGPGHGGFDRLTTTSKTNLSFCASVWALSDVISFSSNLDHPRTGWLLSVANRYGRPVICTNWNPPDLDAMRQTSHHFGRHHVRWFAAPGDKAGQRTTIATEGIFGEQVQEEHPAIREVLDAFKFVRVQTRRAARLNPDKID